MVKTLISLDYASVSSEILVFIQIFGDYLVY